jgi:DNA-binding transcriptional ArsR family regulator
MGINEVFRALADPTRREILRLLRTRDMTAGEIAVHFPLAPSTLSGHFTVLKHAGLVTAERKKTTRVYRLNRSVIAESGTSLTDIFQLGDSNTGRES